MSPDQGLAVIVVGPIAVQLGVYFVLARVAFRVPTPLFGTALTFFVNELYWRLVFGESMLDADTRWSFG